MTKDDIDRIEALLAKATQGEWRIGRGKSGLSVAALAGKCQQVAASSWHNFSEHYPTEAQTVANFEAIVALHNAAPALIAAARENEQRGWQPIETAPRDGTEVLLAITSAGQKSHWVHVGWWNAYDSFPWRFIDSFDLTPTGCCDREDEDRITVNGAKEESVTHWMPLPAPPAALEGDK